MSYSSEKHPVEDGWDGEYCDRCRRPYRMGYLIPDEIWRLLCGKHKTLCLDCLDVLAKEHDLTMGIRINPCWAGWSNLKFITDDLPNFETLSTKEEVEQ